VSSSRSHRPVLLRFTATCSGSSRCCSSSSPAPGLPVDGVLVEVDEREQALTTFSTALRRLPPLERTRSIYVSKMIAAAAAGLFDAALNYLWNETVGELRRRVAGYDLAYFFEIAVPSPDRRKHLSNEEDLTKVDDVDLLRAARQIGLISGTGHAQLDHIRYMRNYASAAHPNQVELTGLQLASWLETCIRQAITLPYDTITAETGRLLSNIKATRLDPAGVAGTTAFFEDLPADRADALAAGLFGLYVDPSRTPIIGDNVLLLWPELWPSIGEEARQSFGLRYGRFRASADLAQARAARELLELVGRTAYLPEKERAVEVDAAVDALLAAHHGYNNFHSEPAPARGLATLIGERGEVPTAVHGKYLRALVEVFLGNSYGVSFAAFPTYLSGPAGAHRQRPSGRRSAGLHGPEHLGQTLEFNGPATVAFAARHLGAQTDGASRPRARCRCPRLHRHPRQTQHRYEDPSPRDRRRTATPDSHSSSWTLTPEPQTSAPHAERTARSLTPRPTTPRSPPTPCSPRPVTLGPSRVDMAAPPTTRAQPHSPHSDQPTERRSR